MEETGDTQKIQIPTDETEAQLFLLQTGVLKSWHACPWCSGDNIGTIRRRKYRCRDCGREWGIRRESILEGTRISCRTFVNTVQLFADDVPVNDAARRLGTAYNTTYDTYARIRHALLSGNNPESLPGDNGSPGGQQTVVFGIRLADKKIAIEPVKNPEPDLITALPIPTMQRGNILFIDAYGKKYQGFITYAPDRRGKDFVRIRSANGFPWSPLAPFWEFAGRSWMTHRGLDRKNIPGFLQELARRYNSRDSDRFREILQSIASYDYSRLQPADPDRSAGKKPGV